MPDYSKLTFYVDAAILAVDAAIFILLVCWMCMDRTNIYWREPKG